MNLCRGSALPVKSPHITVQTCPTTDRPWFRIRIDFAAPINGSYYLAVVDIFMKLPVVVKCKRPITIVTINFLHEILARFDVPALIVSDNRTQFTSSEFTFCKSLANGHITTPYYHLRSDTQNLLSPRLKGH